MSQLRRLCKTLGILGLAVAAPGLVSADATFAPQGAEYAPGGNLPGDQTLSFLSLNAAGGFLVWQDNVTDGDGLGISAVRLDGSFSRPFGVFRVNQQGANDQENPQVALLQNGGAAFVWQGGRQSFQHIYARFLSSSNTFTTGDLQINTATNYQVNPAIAALGNGNVLVTWASYGQDNSDGLQGVYAQLMSPAGQKIGAEIQVNQFTPYNQRNPAVAVLGNGNFVIVWISEQERSSASVGGGGLANNQHNSVDVYARLFSSAGAPLGGEFLVNTGAAACASPSIASGSDGNFIVTWSQKDTVTLNNSWDVFARPFTAAGVGGTVQTVNSQLYGDQFASKISSLGTDYLAVWTSMGQDGSREGVYGQLLNGDGSHSGGEFRVNTTVLNQQVFPAVASDGVGRFLVSWSSFVGGVNSLDLYAQSYAVTEQALPAPNPPFVTPIGSGSLSITWPPVAGFSVTNYDLYVDGSATPTVVTNNMWTLANLAPAGAHTFSLDYVLADGRRSPPSAAASGTTWGVDANGDGLPDNWQARYWGDNPNNWPPANKVIAPGGPTALQVFQWDANPLDAATWLTVSLSDTPQGRFLQWNTVPGLIYQVQTSADLKVWTNLGSPRFSAENSDSLYLGLGSQGYYQIVRLSY